MMVCSNVFAIYPLDVNIFHWKFENFDLLVVLPDNIRMSATSDNDAALLAFLWPGQNGCEPKVAHL